MKDLPNIKKELKMMQNMLKDKPDEKLINGYNRAMEEYKKTGDEQHRNAALFIKKELSDRNIEV